MQINDYQPWLHRAALLTACTALLPIVVGALVTTMNAGMAFSDWPSSDGQNMFLYPWLKSAGDKFIEHGHRLAGALIGMLAIGLTTLAWCKEPRRWVKAAATLVLLAVILQGVLGGQRVLRDERSLAMLHGSLAALVFCLMASVALFTSRSWFAAEQSASTRSNIGYLKPLAVLTPLIILAQYMLGGLLRHMGTALHEHLGLAFLVLVFVLTTALCTHRSRVSWLRRPAWLLLLLLLLQITLGAGAWVTKFGFTPVGYVAVEHSTMQITVRTAHTVLGMLVLMTSVVYGLRVFRYDAISRRNVRKMDVAQRPSSTFSMQGGLG